jgi:hypothetical protein
LQSDGELYAKIRLGFRRHPLLYSTISENDTWAVIVYLRSLGPSADGDALLDKEKNGKS